MTSNLRSWLGQAVIGRVAILYLDCSATENFPWDVLQSRIIGQHEIINGQSFEEIIPQLLYWIVGQVEVLQSIHAFERLFCYYLVQEKEKYIWTNVGPGLSRLSDFIDEIEMDRKTKGAATHLDPIVP